MLPVVATMTTVVTMMLLAVRLPASSGFMLSAAKNPPMSKIALSRRMQTLASTTVAPVPVAEAQAYNPVDLEDRVFQHWKQLGVSARSTVLLSVSGGADSVAMLHLLQALRRRYLPDLDLRVVNFNHKTRNATDEEAEFVAGLAVRYEMEFFLRVWDKDKDKEGSNRSSNFQEAARNWRLEESQRILDGILNPFGKFLATAHHREDQLETILLKVLRGTFISNIRGMKGVDDFRLRPLLQVSKGEILQYLTEQQLPWMEDESNQSRKYKRNRVRLDLIPLLADLTGGLSALESRLSSLSEQSSQITPLLDAEKEKLKSELEYRRYWDGYQTLLFHFDAKKLPELLLGEIIHDWVRRVTGISLSYAMTKEVLHLFDILGSRKSVSTTLSNLWDISLVGTELRLLHRLKKFPFDTCRSTFTTKNVTFSVVHPSFLCFEGGKDVGGEHGWRKFTLVVPKNATNVSLTTRFAEPGERLAAKLGDGSKISQLALQSGALTHDRDRTIVLLEEDSDKQVGIICPEKVIISGRYLSSVGEEAKRINIFFKMNTDC